MKNKGNENRKIGMVERWIGRLLVTSRDRLWRCGNGRDGPTPAGWRISWIQRFRNQKIQGVKGFECMKARVRVSGKRGSSELTSPVVPSFSGGSEPVTRLKNPPSFPLSLLLQPASSESLAGSSLSWESGVFVVCRLDDRRQNNLLLHSCLRPTWSCWELNKSFWEILFMDLADKAGCSRVADG